MAKMLTEEEKAARLAAKIEAARVKAEEESRIEGVNKALTDATIHPEVDNFSKMPEEWHDRNKIPVEERAAAKEAAELTALRKSDAEALKSPKKVRRFSNDDIYELITGFEADIKKETEIRNREKPVDGVKLETAAQLVGLAQGLNAIIQRYKIYAKPSKAF